MNVIFGPYRLDNLLMDGYDVVVNKPKTAAYRAPGGTNVAFAVESVVDELCEKLGMDPLTFRLRNGVEQGDRKVDGPIYPRIGLVEVLEAAQAHPHYRAPLEGPNRGRGVACGYWGNYGGKSERVGQRQCRRYRQPGGGFDRHRWGPHSHRHAVG